MAARRALRPADVLAADSAGVGTGLAVTVLTCLALTWLNPHVYLDTVVLLGSLSATHGGDRWWFAAGAATGSVLWFAALGFGARLLRPVFARPTSWRVLDVLIAVVMTTLGVSLAVRGLSGG
jgi:L-lysine exporter family protein LysE/ArgO